MSVIAIIPDRHKKNVNALSNTLVDPTTRKMYGGVDVRRPTRGIQLKDDTYAVLKVILGNGKTLPLVNAGSRVGATGPEGKLVSDTNSNFLIQNVTEERAEKSQVVETFGEAFIFFFGKRPQILNIQGVLLNTFDFNWESEWWYNYDNYLRGSKCVEYDARVYLTYDETLVSGYIMAASSQKSAQEKNFVSLSFQLFVTDMTNLSRLGDPSADQENIQAIGRNQANAYRPMLMSYAKTTVLDTEITLLDSIASVAKSVQDTWSTAQMIANNLILSAEGMLGNPVRIPVGFAGAMVFNDPSSDRLSVYAGGLDTPVQYTTFGDNTDEFVGTTALYATSYDRDLANSMAASFDGENSAADAAALVDQAQLEWASYGLIPTPAIVNNAVSLLSSSVIGLQVLGTVRKTLGGIGQTLNIGFDVAAPIISGAATSAANGAALTDAAIVDNPGRYNPTTNGQFAAMATNLENSANPILVKVKRGETAPPVAVITGG